MKVSFRKTKTFYGLLLALSVFLFMSGIITAPDSAYAAQLYDREALLKDGSRYPGVYYVKAQKPDSGKTMGIPSISKDTLKWNPTPESPAIIMGAAVPYEKRTGFTTFQKISGGSLYPPYSKFRYTITNEQNLNGATGTHQKISGFDGSYVIIRVDVSDIIAGAPEGSYLHVMQEKNKALMPSAIHVAWQKENGVEVPDGFASFTDTAFGTKAAIYSLANDAASLKDKTGTDNATPYVDLLIYSSGTLVAGADTGISGAISADFNLKMYVDQTKYYTDTEYDPNYQPPEQGGKTMAQLMLEKYYSDSAAVDASYKVKGDDLELEIMVDKFTPRQFWSLRQALAYQSYNDVPIKMICEVPVLTALEINNGRHVIFDVNSFDIQIANHQTTGAAALTIENATLELTDSFETTGAELAVGNNASILIKSGGTLVVTPKCQLEVEYDAASVAPGQESTSYNVGVLTIENGGKILNNGVISVEGKEGKPGGTQTDEKNAEFRIDAGGTLENNGCLLCNGRIYNMGTIVNNGRYAETIVSKDPDKGTFTYHKGLQLSWKDDVTQKSKSETSSTGSPMGYLFNGKNADGTISPDATIVNNGDIVLVPGMLDNYGSVENGAKGNIWLAAVKEAVIPIQAAVWQPSVMEKRIAFEYPIPSDFTNYGELTNSGKIAAADVKIVSNGRTGALTAITSGEMFEFLSLGNHGHLVNIGSVVLESVRNYGSVDNAGSIQNRVMLSYLEIEGKVYAGSLTDTAKKKLDNVYNGARTVNGKTNTWTHAAPASLTVSPATQESGGKKTVNWTARAEAEGAGEGVQYLLEVYESGITGLDIKSEAHYTISAGTESILTSPALPDGIEGQNVIYDFLLADGLRSIAESAAVKLTNTSPVEIAPVPIPDLVYDGAEHELTTAGTWGDTQKTMEYSFDPNSTEWSETPLKGRDAKSYTVYYRYRLGETTGEVRSVQSPVTIAKRPVTISADDAASQVNADLNTPGWTVSGLSTEMVQIANTDVTISTANVNRTEAGTYPIEVTAAAEKYPNYAITVKKGSYYVTQSAFSFIAKDKYDVFKDDTTTATYAGYNIELLFPTAEKPTNTIPPEGVTVYYSTETALTASNYKTAGVTALKQNPAAAGTHTVYFYVTNEKDIAIAGSKQVIIGKAEQAAPDAVKLKVTPESSKNAGDGKIENIESTDTSVVQALIPRSTEYRDKFNDGTYKMIYDERIYVVPGTYLIRRMADTNHYASPDTEVTVAAGGMITVTFDSNGGGAVAPVEGLVCGNPLESYPEPNKPFDNAKFLGWFEYGKRFNEDTPVTFYSSSDSETPEIPTVTLTAGWAPDAIGMTLPAGTKSVAANAFRGAEGIVSLEIPYGCASIDAGAFADCTNLKAIIVPITVKTLDKAAFSGCVQGEQKVYVFGENRNLKDSTEESEAEKFCKDETHRNNFVFIRDVDWAQPTARPQGE